MNLICFSHSILWDNCFELNIVIFYMPLHEESPNPYKKNFTVVSWVCSTNNWRGSSWDSGDCEGVGQALRLGGIRHSSRCRRTTTRLKAHSEGRRAWPGNNKGVKVHTKLEKFVLSNLFSSIFRFELPSISLTLNEQIFHTNVRFGIFFYVHVTWKSCQNGRRTKNLYVDCWWNWHL